MCLINVSIHAVAVYSLCGRGNRDGEVVRALASHQCGRGLIPGLGVICGLSLFLVLVLAPRGFSPVTPIFISPEKSTFSNSNSLWNLRTAGLLVVTNY